MARHTNIATLAMLNYDRDIAELELTPLADRSIAVVQKLGFLRRSRREVAVWAQFAVIPADEDGAGLRKN